MAMSRERVRFVIPECLLNNSQRGKYLKLLDEIFGIKQHEVPRSGEMTIVCRPSQFGRFIIRRYESGAQNLVQALDPKIVPAEEPKRVFDVSQNRFSNEWC